MVPGTRRVVWAESAQRALDEVIEYVSRDSPSGAIRILTRALDAAGSLATLAERGHVVPEVRDPMLREVFGYDYRLLYRVHTDRVVIRAFLHGARDFVEWRRTEGGDV